VPHVGQAQRRTARARLLTLALAAALTLAGCTGGSGNRPEGPGAGNGQGGGSGPRRGGSLAIALLAPRTLDPAYATRAEEQLVVGNLFDGLTDVDAGGAVRPAVAASWSSDASLRHWRFQLRPDATYSDGTPVEAGDFQRAWERLSGPRTRPRPASPAALLGMVEGYEAFASGRAGHIAGLRAPDPVTLLVDLSQPLADLPAVVSNPRLSPVPAGAVAGAAARAAFAARPAGDGPFTLAARYAKGKPFDLVPSPAFSGRRPDLDRVRVVTVPDEQTAWLALQHNQVRFASVPLDQVAAARVLEGLSADGHTRPGLLQGPQAGTWSLGFGFGAGAGPAKDPRWRQAVSLATDRQRLAATLAGAFSPASGIVPHGIPGAGQPTACPTCTHDAARARVLLEEVGKAGGSGRPVDLAIPATSLDRRIAAFIASDLAKVGIKVHVVEVDPARYQASLAKPPALFALAETAAYPRMDAFLSRQFSTRGSVNLTHFSDPIVDGLLARARATADQATRTSLYQQAESAILARLPIAPVLEQRHSAVLTPGVEGFDLTPWGALDLATVHLTSSPR
jgi:oligopeptide transport system substrate-binding protein